MGNVFLECQAPCKQNTSFVDFEKEEDNNIAVISVEFIGTSQLSILLHWQSEVAYPVNPSLPSFLYIIELVVILNIAELLSLDIT